MALAETAKLAVELNLSGNFASGVTSAESRLSTFSSTVGTKAHAAVTKLGGALGHAGSQIKNLITSPLGLLGLGGAMFSVAGAIEKGITKAQDFGAEVRQLTALTGLTVPTVSALAAAMEHFGLTADKTTRLVGFLEKNVGLLAARKNGIIDFQKQFGLQLTDNHGKLLDANKLILQTADYFNNKSIPATTKAAALAKLYGRSWQDLIPFLKAGRQGIIDAEAEAAKLGLTLTKDNVDALAKMKTATRELDTAMGGLQLQIGLALVPALTDLATAASHFVADDRTDIVNFFKNAASVARVVAGDVIGLARTIGDFWNSIPPGVRDMLVKGLIADRTVKFLFGFDALSLGKDLVGSLAGGVAKGLGQAGIGKLFVQPVFVTNMGGVGGGGIPGAGSAGGGLLGAIPLVGFTALVAGATYLALDTWTKQNKINAGVNPNSFPTTLDNKRNTATQNFYHPGDKIPKVDIRKIDDQFWRSQDNHLASIQRYTQQQADKRESNRINIVNQIPIRINIAGSQAEAGATVHRSVTRNGAPIAF